jgi:hypothetical protein
VLPQPDHGPDRLDAPDQAKDDADRYGLDARVPSGVAHRRGPVRRRRALFLGGYDASGSPTDTVQNFQAANVTSAGYKQAIAEDHQAGCSNRRRDATAPERQP